MVCLSYILIFVEKKTLFEFLTVSDTSSVRNLFLTRRFIPVKTAMRRKLPNPVKYQVSFSSITVLHEVQPSAISLSQSAIKIDIARTYSAIFVLFYDYCVFIVDIYEKGQNN